MPHALLRLLATWLALAVPAGGALACSCLGLGEPTQANVDRALSQHDAVFVGQVATLTEHEIEMGADPARNIPGFKVMRQDAQWRIVEAFKGAAVGMPFETQTIVSCCMCGLPLTRGVTYLIYTSRSSEGRYSISSCSRSGPIDEAGRDRTLLRASTALSR